MSSRDYPPLTRPDEGALGRQHLYLQALQRGLSVGQAAAAAGVRVDSLPHWRFRYPSFADQEREIRDRVRVHRDTKNVATCPCGEQFMKSHADHTYCSVRCVARYSRTLDETGAERILEILERGPVSRKGLMDETGMSLSQVRTALRNLFSRGLAEPVGAKRGPFALWGVAGEKRLPADIKVMRGSEDARVFKLLQMKWMTAPQIAEATGLTRSQTRRVLLRLRAQGRVVVSGIKGKLDYWRPA